MKQIMMNGRQGGKATFTEVSWDVQQQVGRENLLRLLKRCGEAARASDNAVSPLTVLVVMQARLSKGKAVDEIAGMSNGKLIQLARKHGK